MRRSIRIRGDKPFGKAVHDDAFRGGAMSILWGWFIVPVFHTGALSVVQAMGVLLVVSYLTKSMDTEEKSDESLAEQFAKGFMMALLKPGMALLIGWILHSVVHGK